MIAYCDRLSWWSCLAALRLRWTSRRGLPLVLRLLDPIGPGRTATFLRRLLALGGIRTEEAAADGRLPGPDGSAVRLWAGRLASEVVFTAADALIRRSPVLAGVSAAFPANAIRLHLAKRLLWNHAEPVILRMGIVDLLGRRDASPPTLLLRHPVAIDPVWVRPLFPSIDLRTYGTTGLLWRAKLRFLVRWIGRLGVGIELPRWAAAGTPSRPSLLIMQETDLSLDRSYRTQPHWLFPDRARPPFDTYVLPNSPPPRAPYDIAALGRYGVRRLERQRRFRPRPGTALGVTVARLRRACLAGALASRSSEDTVALFWVAELLGLADEMIRLCLALNARAFMTSENYLPAAEAVCLVAPALGVRTLSYQYSNLGYAVPTMLTTAQTMLTISPLFHSRWSLDGIVPGEFRDIGYPFDSSFALVRERARALRQRLQTAGAGWIICYFDETVERHKFGLVTPADAERDMRVLLEHLRRDPSAGVVVKTQYLRNSPSYLGNLAGLLEEARATTRFVDLRHGFYRNDVFPAEAALAADVAIGYIAGGTASLEAALVGTRSVLLNPYGMRVLNDDLYAQADIVFPDLEAALQAMDDYRRGRRPTFGDWSAILPRFDPFRDGQAGHRMYRTLEEVILADGLHPPQADGRAR